MYILRNIIMMSIWWLDESVVILLNNVACILHVNAINFLMTSLAVNKSKHNANSSMTSLSTLHTKNQAQLWYKIINISILIPSIVCTSECVVPFSLHLPSCDQWSISYHIPYNHSSMWKNFQNIETSTVISDHDMDLNLVLSEVVACKSSTTYTLH